MKRTVKIFIALFLMFSLTVNSAPFINAANREVPNEESIATGKSTSNVIDQPLELSEETVPETLEYIELKEKGHIKRLYGEEENMATAVFLNQDGTKSAYFFSEPVKYKDSNGNIKDKRTRISETTDKNSKVKYQTSENDIILQFPKSISDGVKIKHSLGEISISPINNASIKSSKEAKKTETTIKNKNKKSDKIVYSDVYGEGTSLVYYPTLSGLKEEIVLKKNIGINTFDFLVNTSGHSIIADESGTYQLIDAKSSAAIGSFSNIVIFDNNGKCFDGKINFTTVETNKTYKATITIDEKILESEDVSYPVIIDPSINILSINNSTIIDANLLLGSGATSYDYCVIGNTDGSVCSRVLFKTPGLYNSSLYNNITTSQITNVSINLYCTSYRVGMYMAGGVCYSYLNSWTEAQVHQRLVSGDSYNNNYSGWFLCSTTNMYNGINITDIVKAWKSNNAVASYGFIMMSLDEDYEYGVYCSSECFFSENKPYITFTYTSTPTTETEGITDGSSYIMFNNYSGNTAGVDSYSNNLLQFTNPSYTNQQFIFDYISNGEYELKPVSNPNVTLDINTQNYTVFTNSDTNSNTQRWYIDKVNPGQYVFRSKAYPERALSVSSIYTITNINALPYSSLSTNNQNNVWTIYSTKGNIIVLTNHEGTAAKNQPTYAYVAYGSSNAIIRYTNNAGFAVFDNLTGTKSYGIIATCDGYLNKAYSTSSTSKTALSYNAANNNVFITINLTAKSNYPQVDFNSPVSIGYLPVNLTGQHFSWRVPYSGNPLDYHGGVDISRTLADTQFGSLTTKPNALSIYNGIVYFYNKDIDDYAGRFLRIKYDFNSDGFIEYYTVYCHLASIEGVFTQPAMSGSINVTVAKGYSLGVIGGSGKGSESGYGVHLHFGITTGDAVDRKVTDNNAIDPIVAILR